VKANIVFKKVLSVLWTFGALYFLTLYFTDTPIPEFLNKKLIYVIFAIVLLIYSDTLQMSADVDQLKKYFGVDEEV